MSNMRNKIITAAVLSIFLLSGFFIFKSQAFAAASDDNSIKVAIEGNYLSFDVPPTIISGRTMVPLRVIFEGLGASVTWDSKTKTVIGQKQGKTVKLIINNKNAYINGKVHKIDVPPMVINGRTLVPTRFIAESLGTDVYWDAKTKTVTIIPAKAINIPDAKLEAALRTALNKPTGSIMTTDAKELKKLNLENKGISQIEGLQYFRGLTELILNKNNIKDITSLGSLTELTKLEFRNNKVKDVSVLKHLTKLTWLLVSENQITDISPIKELSGMSALDISYNQINDISCLSNLKKLEYFYLLDNPLSDISVLKGYKNLKKIYVVDSKNPDKLNQQLFDRFEKMDKKVKEVVASVIRPEMTELEKEIALHDYVVTHVKYDKVNFINDTLPPDTHEAYGALINGSAVCDGYAEALQLLLNAVGIECIKVRGEADFLTGSLSTTRKDGTKWGHAWNMVKINGVYYHVDPTANDDDLDDGGYLISYFHFNLSDKQLGVEYKWDREAYPACDSDSQFFDMDIKEKRDVIIANDQYYFINSKKNIVKKSFDGNIVSNLVNDQAAQIVLHGEFIYYINESDGGSIYRVKPDGSERAKICEGKVYEIEPSGESIYYIKNNKLNRMNLDGNNQTTISYDWAVAWVDIVGDTMYYKCYNNYIARIVKADLNGNNKMDVSTDEPSGFIRNSDGTFRFWYYHSEHIINDWLYYVNVTDQRTIYKVKLDGTERTKITTDSVTDTNYEDIQIYDNYIFYRNSLDGNKVYRIKTDGSNRQIAQ